MTITIGRAAFAVAGMSTAAAGASAIILATGGAALLVGGGIYLVTRSSQTKLPRLPKDEGSEINDQFRTLSHVAR